MPWAAGMALLQASSSLGAPVLPKLCLLCSPAPLPQKSGDSSFPWDWQLGNSSPQTDCSRDFSFAHGVLLFCDPSGEGVLLLLRRRQCNSLDAEEEHKMPFSV